MTSSQQPLRVYRWDLDKTYLQTDFDTFAQVIKTALQRASEKRAVPGAAALIRELRTTPGSRLCIVSGSPVQMRKVLCEKLQLDGVVFDELVLKDTLRNLVRGRFKAVRGQVGYKLPVLLESRALLDASVEEVLFGDDAEADALIYSLYADMVARRVDEATVASVLAAAEVYPDEQARIFTAWRAVPTADAVRRIFINLDRLTPPAFFSRYGARVVPIFNYFQAALVMMSDRHLGASGVLRVMSDLVHSSGYHAPAIANSLQDLARRGFPTSGVVETLAEALNLPTAAEQASRLPLEVLQACARRVSVLGWHPKLLQVAGPDYLAVLSEGRAKRRKSNQ